VAWVGGSNIAGGCPGPRGGRGLSLSLFFFTFFFFDRGCGSYFLLLPVVFSPVFIDFYPFSLRGSCPSLYLPACKVKIFGPGQVWSFVGRGDCARILNSVAC
jgi:hypothetical protein